MPKFIPIARPVVGRGEIKAVKRVLKSKMLAQGKEVFAFESEFSRVLELNQGCVAVNSGTSGLHLALLAAGIGPYDEVLVPSFTFAATANAVALTGASPVFVDIDLATFNLDHSKVSEAITSRTKAIMVVHLYGQSANMRPLVELAKRHNLLIFEDASQSHGSTFDGNPVGTFGEFAVFSFYPTKNMTTGEGGLVTSPNEALLRKVRLLRNQGMDKPYENEVVGFNARMTDIQASIGRVQVRKLARWTLSRQQNATFLSEALTDLVIKPEIAPDVSHVFHQYTIRIPEDRDAFAVAMSSEFGIGTGIYYPNPCHLLPSLRKYPSGHDLSATIIASKTVLSLPVRPDLTRRELHRIASAVNKLASAGA